jgi:hypothetical protein
LQPNASALDAKSEVVQFNLSGDVTLSGDRPDPQSGPPAIQEMASAFRTLFHDYKTLKDRVIGMVVGSGAIPLSPEH